jgi:hypothetical protein
MSEFAAAAINKALKGFTELRRFDLHLVQAGVFALDLHLANNKAATLHLRFHDVRNLELNPTAEGFEQMIRLEVEDLADQGLDRIKFIVDELERETLFLHCGAVEIVAQA